MAGTVARVTEISATSDTSFVDAVQIGLDRATATLRGVKSAWVKEQEVLVGDNGNISGYKVNLLVEGPHRAGLTGVDAGSDPPRHDVLRDGLTVALGPAQGLVLHHLDADQRCQRADGDERDEADRRVLH